MTTVRTGIGFDAHRFADDRRLVLGGVEIDDCSGLEGHSDADVLCHAVADALLGAMADGDIGTHFPDSDDKWRDANSLHLLQVVSERLRSSGSKVVNVDSTVIAEAPRVAGYADMMRANIASALGLPISSVSVKGTTTEKMGPIGRREGIAVLAVASVETGQ
jgi:2-C-methyl-D-erythritol 2,4-cyclodiphosphate synthase